MWAHYRKTFFPIQMMIILICIALHFHWGVPAVGLAAFVLVMELFAVLGAMWAMRLRRKIARARGTLL
jgi:hypothetical protein